MAGADKNQRVAVFTRNHKGHLARALELSRRDPPQPAVFRSRARWVSAAEAVERQDVVHVYIAEIDGSKDIVLQAELARVCLLGDEAEREQNKDAAKELLRLEAAANSGEGLWEDSGGLYTLYVLRNCREVTSPFPMTELIKVSDGQPLSEDYGYSYSVVQERP